MFRKYLLPVTSILAILLALLGVTRSALAAEPNGVDHLRGRWDGVITNLHGSDQPFVLMLDDFGLDPNDPQATLFGGCMAVGQGGMFTPVSVRALPVTTDIFDLTLFGTAVYGGDAFIIKLTGQAYTNAPRVTDDPAGGTWYTAGEEDDWSAFHHDRREPNCPAVQLGSGAFFVGDVYASITYTGETVDWYVSLFEGVGNIVASAMQITIPNGDVLTAPFFTDLFSPSEDFINEFRFFAEIPNEFPASGETYIFTLLDVFGQSIPGTTVTDVWYDCPQDPPHNVSATLDSNGITLNWDAVSPAPGFDPGGSIPQGFYQVAIWDDILQESQYGANPLRTAHLIPQDAFGGFAPGIPDGYDFGKALDELEDGTYGLVVFAFAEAPQGGEGVRLECHVRKLDEEIHLEKSGGSISILP